MTSSIRRSSATSSPTSRAAASRSGIRSTSISATRAPTRNTRPAWKGSAPTIRSANNVLYDVSSQPGFGGHAGITAFFVSGLSITNNYINKTAYNGINLGLGMAELQGLDDLQEQRGEQQPARQHAQPPA
jgi:hypothetical protein